MVGFDYAGEMRDEFISVSLYREVILIMKKTIVIGSDHAGYPMKQFLLQQLQDAGYSVEDMGTHDEESCNTQPYAQSVAEEVAKNGDKLGILVCGTGAAMCIMANKVKGARAVVVHDLFTARMTRTHNDANILCMGQRVIADHMAWEITKTWLSYEPLGDKYAERRETITKYEEEHMK